MERKKRTIIMGDIHGCVDEFNDLLLKLKYNSNDDRLILGGDLIDRGPKSVEMVRQAREMNLECVMGNHEYKFLTWYKNQGTNMKNIYDSYPHYTKFDEKDINYMAQMPLYIKIDNYIIVHAGLKAGYSLESKKKDDLLYLRYTDKNSKFISLKKINKIGKDASDAHFWTEFWQGPESVIYGHNVHSYDEPLIEEVAPNVFCYGLDTGVCFGGNLTAMILETKEIVQVPARKVYYQSSFNTR